MQIPKLSKCFLLAAIAFQWVAGGWLGILVQDLTPRLAARYGVFGQKGVLVTRVQFNSPAAAGGIKEGDVIVSLEGEDVSSSDELVKKIGKLSRSESIKLGILRRGTKRTIHILLGAKPRAET